MGLLQEGRWVDRWYETKDPVGGSFAARPSSGTGLLLTRAGPNGKGGFKAEAGRYHLYVSLACPWAHRTLIFRT